MSPAAYRIFLSHNIRRETALMIKTAHDVAAEHQVELVMLQAGPSNPAEEARQILEEKSVEGLLAIFHEETGWVSSEIGMAVAFRLPIFVIADTQLAVGGISAVVTRIRHTDIFNPEQLRTALGEGLSALKTEIDKRRARLPEPPTATRVEIFPWRRYYELIKKARRDVVARDASGAQQGFKPTLILGISRGGIVAADVLSRQGGDIRLGLLDADRISVENQVSYPGRQPLRVLLEDHLDDLGPRKQARILIVDDVLKSGTSLKAAVDHVRSILGELRESRSLAPELTPKVRSLVLIRAPRGKPKIDPDYACLTLPGDVALVLPYGLG